MWVCWWCVLRPCRKCAGYGSFPSLVVKMQMCPLPAVGSPSVSTWALCIFSSVDFNCLSPQRLVLCGKKVQRQGLFPSQAVSDFPGHEGCGKAEKGSVFCLHLRSSVPQWSAWLWSCLFQGLSSAAFKNKFYFCVCTCTYVYMWEHVCGE